MWSGLCPNLFQCVFDAGDEFVFLERAFGDEALTKVRKLLMLFVRQAATADNQTGISRRVGFSRIFSRIVNPSISGMKISRMIACGGLALIASQPLRPPSANGFILSVLVENLFDQAQIVWVVIYDQYFVNIAVLIHVIQARGQYPLQEWV